MPMSKLPHSVGDHLLAFGALLERSGKIIESQIRGTSMGSALPAGRRIRIRPIPADEYCVGHVVAFVSGNTLFAHRIVFCGRQGILTRGDASQLCDLPVPFAAVLGLVDECSLNGEWRPLPDQSQFEYERRATSSAAEMLLGVCMRIDIRLAWCGARMLMQVASWRRAVLKITPIR